MDPPVIPKYSGDPSSVAMAISSRLYLDTTRKIRARTALGAATSGEIHRQMQEDAGRRRDGFPNQNATG